MQNKTKIINDPVHGFITIPSGLIFQVIQHPYVQRLRRIRQLGLNELVYPGASHTRFHHALGAFHLTQLALEKLSNKNVQISAEEKEATLLAILLHDVGHGPFSHTLEHVLVKGVHHEQISLAIMHALNKELNGGLNLCLQIFQNQYKAKPFLHQLISSQLDMDRLDYLMRDSFYTGVSEGIVGAERLIHMLNVHDGNLVVEEKGLYSVEKFLMARRLMYWQVYLHKTVIGADELLMSILHRARYLAEKSIPLGNYFTLIHFLGREISIENFDQESLELYTLLDDNDIYSAIKNWMQHEDIILSTLCKQLIYRQLPKTTLRNQPFLPEEIEIHTAHLKQLIQLENAKDSQYFIKTGRIKNDMYNVNAKGISILLKNNTIADFSELAVNYNFSSNTEAATKYYLTHYTNWQMPAIQ